MAGEIEFIGTNTGPRVVAGNELKPTGRSIVGRGAYFARFEGDKVVEFNAYPDMAGMMMQLGLLPGR